MMSHSLQHMNPFIAICASLKSVMLLVCPQSSTDESELRVGRSRFGQQNKKLAPQRVWTSGKNGLRYDVL